MIPFAILAWAAVETHGILRYVLATWACLCLIGVGVRVAGR